MRTCKGDMRVRYLEPNWGMTVWVLVETLVVRDIVDFPMEVTVWRWVSESIDRIGRRRKCTMGLRAALWWIRCDVPIREDSERNDLVMSARISQMQPVGEVVWVRVTRLSRSAYSLPNEGCHCEPSTNWCQDKNKRWKIGNHNPELSLFNCQLFFYYT